MDSIQAERRRMRSGCVRVSTTWPGGGGPADHHEAAARPDTVAEPERVS